MLNKEIIDKINQFEMDPQDNDLFGNIMNKRKTRNTNTGYLVLGSIAVMLITISLVGMNKFWGVIPDGYSRQDIEMIQNQESKNAKNENAVQINNAIQTKSEVLEINKSNAKANNALVQNNNTVLGSEKVSKTPIIIKKSDGIVVENLMNQKTAVQNPITNKKPKETLALINPNVIEKDAEIKSTETFVLIDATTPQLRKIASIITLDIEANKLELAKVDEKENKTAKLKYLPREINVFATAMYNQRFLNGTDADLVSDFNNREHINSTYGFGFSAEFGQIKNIFFQAGISQLTVKQSVKNYTRQTVDVRTGNSVDPGGNPQQIVLRDTTYLNVNGGNSVSNFINIPLTVGMRWQKNRHIFQPQFGVITSFYTHTKGISLNSNAEAFSISKKIDRLKTISLSTVGGFSYSYIFANRMAVYINPQLRYSLTNMNKQNTSFNQFNSMVGVEFGIKYIVK